MSVTTGKLQLFGLAFVTTTAAIEGYIGWPTAVIALGGAWGLYVTVQALAYRRQVVATKREAR